ncbi:MAG: hypothetical protein HOL41_18895, partial [Rhodospirillaceae bacterium]|nr:hypothetical protein [Rhodospirillaceae bacterium]
NEHSEAKIMDLSPWQRHAIFHMTCTQIYDSQRSEQNNDSSQLTANGFATIDKCLSKDEARHISTEITQVLEQKGPDSGAYKPISDDAKGTLVTVPQEGGLLESLREALPKILNPRVEAELHAYYGSYFRVYSGITYRTHAVTHHANSFLWHRDMAPMSQVHLML